jgi:hypothetical protein
MLKYHLQVSQVHELQSLNIFPLRVLGFRQIQFLSSDGRTHFFSGKSQNVHPHFVSGFSSVLKPQTLLPTVGSGFNYRCFRHRMPCIFT